MENITSQTILSVFRTGYETYVITGPYPCKAFLKHSLSIIDPVVTHRNLLKPILFSIQCTLIVTPLTCSSSDASSGKIFVSRTGKKRNKIIHANNSTHIEIRS